MPSSATKARPKKAKNTGSAAAQAKWGKFVARLNDHLSIHHGDKKAFAGRLGISRVQFQSYLNRGREPRAALFVAILAELGWASEHGALQSWEVSMAAADEFFQQAEGGLKSVVAHSLGMSYLQFHRYIRLQKMPPASRAMELLAAIRKARGGQG